MNLFTQGYCPRESIYSLLPAKVYLLNPIARENLCYCPRVYLLGAIARENLFESIYSAIVQGIYLLAIARESLFTQLLPAGSIYSAILLAEIY